MKIRLYECTDPDVPPKRRWVSIYFDQGDSLPVRHFGADAESVRAQAQTWWDEQVAKAGARANRAPPKKKPADPGDVI